MAENRRVKMTKSLIKGAYLDLLKEKPSNRISVTEVCSLADVNRSTFYAHYKDLDSLHREMEQDLFSRIPVLEAEGEPGSLDQNRAKIQGFFRYVYEEESLCSLLLISRTKEGFEKSLADMVFERYRPGIESAETLEIRATYVFCVSGVIGAMSDWVRSGFPASPEEFGTVVHEMCRKMVSR